MTIPNYSLSVHTLRALCLFKLNSLDAAALELATSPNSHLTSRIKFKLSQLSGDEDAMVSYNLLIDTPENLICMASTHFQRSNIEEAIEIYKRLIVDEKEFVALHF